MALAAGSDPERVRDIFRRSPAWGTVTPSSPPVNRKPAVTSCVARPLPALNRSRSVWFLVSGAGKAPAVAAALSGADVHEVPAAGVTGREETIWFLDRGAASAL